jgi:hypothetical protein
MTPDQYRAITTAGVEDADAGDEHHHEHGHAHAHAPAENK